MFCWFFRLMISHAADKDEPLSRATLKHVRHCRRCGKFHESCQALSKDLRKQVHVFDRPLSAERTQAIQAAVRGGPAKTRSVTLWWRPIAAAACIALITCASIFIFAKRRQSREPTDPGMTGLAQVVGQDLAGAWTALLEKPLADEMRNIVEDTETAARFLYACVAVDMTNRPPTPANN
jgi:hypothetical protein